MKLYELKPTNENLLDNFLKDTVLRNADIFRFINILNILDECCSIALDGNWGCGKTFFVKQTKMIMDAFNKYIAVVDENEREEIIQKCSVYELSDELEMKPQICVYYDAWENDNDEDPMLSLVYSIMQSVGVENSFKEGGNYLDLGVSILQFFTEKKFGQIIEKLRGNDPLGILKEDKDIKIKIARFLESIRYERGERLVIFIDELDRCKPEYAVRLLERVKHYFENDHITFVFSTNMKELQHTIRRYYGEEFNACKYLDRFFDLQITLPKVDYERFYQSIGFDSEKDRYNIACDAVIRAFHFELREVAKYLRLSKIAICMQSYEDRFTFSAGEKKGNQFCLCFIVPIMIGLRFYNIDIYENFIHGKDSSPLISISQFISCWYFGILLQNNETYENPDEKQTRVLLEQKIKEVYNAVFIKEYTESERRVVVGKCAFVKETKELLLSISGLLSKYAEWEED